VNLSRIVERWAQHFPSKVALHFHGTDYTYAQLWTRIQEVSSSLQINKGERIAWLGYNHPDMLVLLFAAARRGAILVPLNWRLATAEHKRILADCTPKLIFSDPDFAEPASKLGLPVGRLDAADNENFPGEDKDDLLIVYTSGTTGAPKGAVLTQAALLWNGFNSIHAHNLSQSDHVLSALPMFHVGGLNNQTLPALLAGATVTLHKRFEPGAWLADVAKRRPTVSLLVPATMAAVIGHPHWKGADLSSLKLLNTGSMVVPGSLIRAFHEREVPVGQIYGCTETAPIAVVLLREQAFEKLGSTGKPAPHCEVKLVDGEIWVRGPAVMRGYWPDYSGLTPEGWFRTGDLARVDEEGFYWIVGRSKEVIISGGENIHPAELENVLADCPGIVEAAVVGVQDPKWGESACACVVSKLGEKEILKLFEDRLARYKHPRRIAYFDALPRNAMGKVLKSELRAALASRGGKKP
jgi:fatty-acyl-CoA synthase